jgi:hypothetical protein
MADVFELALNHLQSNGMSEPDALQVLEQFGGGSGKDIPWADIQPYLDKRQVERLDRAAVGWLTVHRLTDHSDDPPEAA